MYSVLTHKGRCAPIHNNTLNAIGVLVIRIQHYTSQGKFHSRQAFHDLPWIESYIAVLIIFKKKKKIIINTNKRDRSDVYD